MIRQLAFEGRIDLAEADIFDRRWWLRLEWLMDRLEEENLLEVFRLDHQHNVALLPFSDEEGKSERWTRLHEILERCVDSRFPWIKDKPSPREKSGAIAKLAKTWEDVWGDLNDIETQRKVWNTVRFLDPKAEVPAHLK